MRHSQNEELLSMVNLSLETMDDYGMIEPTDVGTVSVDYDSKDDLKRKNNRWDHEETVCLLNLIKENNFINRYSVIKMSTLLCQMMQTRGYNRTDKQIQMKLTTLRKNYLTFTRQKVNSNNIKECPFYKELCEIYKNADDTNGYDSDEYENDDECLIKFPDDPVEWTKAEVQKMLNQIKYMKLKNELTLTFFSPVAVKMIAEAMQKFGYDRSVNSVKNALLKLRTMYIDYKMGCENNENPQECIFYSCLDMYWGKEFKKCLLREKRRVKAEEPWSTEETIVLLTCIRDLNIVEEAYKNTEKSAEDVRLAIEKQGFNRTKQQIMQRLIQLKKDFVSVHTSCSEAGALQKFPFYILYKKLFERHITEEIIRSNTKNVPLVSSKDSNDQWKNEEVSLLLKTVQEITSKSQMNDSLEDEKLQKLVKVLSQAGHQKTADQIKRKLALLKNSYLKCNQDNSSEKDIVNCPFYNELHNIFHTPVSDQSYTNVKFENGCLGTGENKVNDKVTVVPNKCINAWFPVESIIDDDGTCHSASHKPTNIGAISNTEQKQEETISATLSDNGDSKEENRTIAEDPSFSFFPQTLNVIDLEDHIPSCIIDNVALHQEVETTTEENDLDCSKVITAEKSEGQISLDLSTSFTLSSPADEDGQPLSKKPRILEEEKIGKTNKIVLRRVDGPPSCLNISKSTSKFVRLIVAHDSPNSKSNLVDHITAHIKPLSLNTTAATLNSTVNSQPNSPVDRLETVKLNNEKLLKEYVMAQERQSGETLSKLVVTQEPITNGPSDYLLNGSSSTGDNSKDKISESITEAVQSMMKHDEVMQDRHHSWMEQQFEIQRKHEEEQNKIMVKELQELRKCIGYLIASKMPHANNQHR
ncbi:uncharacterized protein LOC106637652 isoform X2 [Copidosoma floridanum]|uniref:uncharacterized protein LOC106637652 isoform X2 n=1 Tax=Copidosoma floridanum TaxID=29053 RepID=UPI0006C99D42|nr:uncharacterized protein LOC106637652 isoform X2 [Copidosoma floridanum]